jgi:predicted nuclease of restriction endonuclease-like (RecB) superfamily
MAAFDNNWSRNILDLQLESNLYARQGKSITNFHSTLPKPQADLANELLKDPYIFDFLTLENEVQELELERQLTQYITKFLLELGAGFAFVGRQYPLEIGNKEYVFDLLFYHLKLRCFVVIDLKMREFEPEHAGKMNFYLSAADDLLKTTLDEPSIGIILCRSKNKIEVEYALRDLNKPIGVSEFILSHHLPDNLRSNLPTVEQIQEEMERRLAELDL